MEAQEAMNMTITGRHMEMTDALKAYVEGSLERVVEHFDKVIDVDVVLEVQKHRHIAEVNLHANGIRIHSRESSPDMYASVDTAMSKLDKQIRKYRDRINNHKPRRAKEKRDFEHAIIAMGESNGEEHDDQEHEAAHRVVRREKLSMKPLSLDEAVMQLELVNDPPFLVFHNADTSEVNVLCAREDGTFSLLEPKF